jgi:hypothetical protein
MSGDRLDADTAVTSPVRIVAYGQQDPLVASKRGRHDPDGISEQQAEIKVVTSNSQPVESARNNPYRSTRLAWPGTQNYAPGPCDDERHQRYRSVPLFACPNRARASGKRSSLNEAVRFAHSTVVLSRGDDMVMTRRGRPEGRCPHSQVGPRWGGTLLGRGGAGRGGPARAARQQPGPRTSCAGGSARRRQACGAHGRAQDRPSRIPRPA